MNKGLGPAAGWFCLLVMALGGVWLVTRRQDDATGRVWEQCPATGHWYTLLRENLAWSEAAALAEHLGGHLVSINSAAEQRWLEATLLNRDIAGAFIGLQRDAGGTWTWVDGAAVSFQYWSPGSRPTGPDAAATATVACARGATHADAFYWNPVEPAATDLRCAIVERTRRPPAAGGHLGLLAGLLALTLVAVGATLRAVYLPPGGPAWDLGRPALTGPPHPTGLRRLPVTVRTGAGVLAAAAAGLLLAPAGVIPPGVWVRRAETGHWYRLDGPGLGWEAAHQTAARHGGHLAMVETAAENRWLMARLLNRPLHGAWVGHWEQGRKGNYVNADGTLTGYQEWETGQPPFECWYPVQRVHLLGPWELGLNRLGRWRSCVAEPWYLAEGEPGLVGYGLTERDNPPPWTARPGSLAGWVLLLLAGLVLGSAACELAAGILGRSGWAGPAVVALPAVGAASWLLLTGSPAARFEWTRNPATGHWYTLAPQRGSWDEAAEAAAACGAYLVCLADEAEHRWVCAKLLDFATVGAYLGLREAGLENRWRWVDGRDAAFTAWAPGEPRNASALAADVATLAGRLTPQTTHRWRDLPRNPACAPADPRAEFAVFERDTDPAAPRRRAALASLLLLLLSAATAGHGWHCTRSHRAATRWCPCGLAAVAGLSWWGGHRDPAGPTPRVSNPTQAPPARPEPWPRHLATHQPPPPLTWDDYRVSPLDGMPQVHLPAGILMWGSPPGVGPGDEQPRSRRAVGDVWLDLHEVTWAQYARFLNDLRPDPATRRRWVLLAGEEPAGDPPPRLRLVGAEYALTDPRWARHPAAWVTWDGARAYAWWAGRRLPTEAEWELANRGDLVNAAYPWGDESTPPPRAGNFRDDSWWRVHDPSGPRPGFDDGEVVAAAVGRYAPGRWGLYDLAGNLREWCEDWYDPDVHRWAEVIEPLGVIPHGQNVCRGGSYLDPLPDQRTSRRRPVPRGWRGPETGFRCVSFASPPTQPDRAGALPPAGWPAWLDAAGFVPPVGMSWRSLRVGGPDAMPQVLVPGGEFTLGCVRSELTAALGQLPQGPVPSTVAGLTEVEVPRRIGLDQYWIDLHEVTVEQYATFCRATGRRGFQPAQAGPRQPVTNVAWADAAAYAAWVGGELPSEAQWEMAARGRAKERVFWWGDTWDPRLVNRADRLEPVGSRGVNGLGLADALGGVSEWCRDTYHPDAYPRLPYQNPVMAEPGVERVHRGGSHRSPALSLRCGARRGTVATSRQPDLGFRCVRH